MKKHSRARPTNPSTLQSNNPVIHPQRLHAPPAPHALDASALPDPTHPSIHQSTNPTHPHAPPAPDAPPDSALRIPHSAFPSLTDTQQAILADALLQGLADHDAQKLAANDFHLDLPLSFFPPFFTAVCIPRLQARQAQALAVAQALATQTDQVRQRLDQLVLDALTRKTFELSLSPQANSNDLKAFFNHVLRARALKLHEARLGLERQKFEFLQSQHSPESRAGFRDPREPLTEEQRTAILDKVDEIFGIQTPKPWPEPPPPAPSPSSLQNAETSIQTNCHARWQGVLDAVRIFLSGSRAASFRPRGLTGPFSLTLPSPAGRGFLLWPPLENRTGSKPSPRGR